ncbi:hypothetical protein IX95_10295 [Vibrio sp. B183]|nr:hypothetical protein [Vibrio sp. B183]KFI12031.1 hypothetical protein IX95_10295 [Vibrio sp. B183]
MALNKASKKIKKEKFKAVTAVELGAIKIRINGRPKFHSRTLKKRPVSKSQHRRHVIHYSESLKPLVITVLEKVFEGVTIDTVEYREKVTDIRTRMTNKNIIRSGAKNNFDLNYLVEQLVTAVNSIEDNLISDEGSTNNAIEHVRTFVKEAKEAIVGMPIDQAKFKALEKLTYEDDSTPIKAEMVRIVKIIREWVTCASSIDELTQSLDNARYGVTTDMPFAWKKTNGRLLSWHDKAYRVAHDPHSTGKQALDVLLEIF